MTARTRSTRFGISHGEALEPRVLLATFLVTSDASAGPNTLRAAIVAANDSPGRDEIVTFLPAASRIALQSALPAITDPVSLDLGSGRVELDGAAAGNASDGLLFAPAAGGSQLRGFVVRRFGGSGVVVQARDVTIYSGTVSGNGATTPDGSGIRVAPGGSAVIGWPVIQGNFTRGPVNITGNRNDGLLVDRGTASVSEAVIVTNGGYGISVRGEGGRVFVDGPAYPPLGKVPIPVGGNGDGGIYLGPGSGGSQIRGAFVFNNGYDLGAGEHAGVLIEDSADNLVDGSFIGGNQWGGVTLTGPGADRNTLRRNTIGPFALNAPAGAAAMPQGPGLPPLGWPVEGNRFHGVALLDGASDNRVGTIRQFMLGPSEGNTIHSNGFPLDRLNIAVGILIDGDGTDGNFVAANTITGNIHGGIAISGGASANVIGGNSMVGGGNTIADNMGAAIGVSARDTEETRYNLIAVNSIHGKGFGIDLLRVAGPGTGPGHTPNDPLDADTGGNDLQNYPVVTSAVRSGTATTVTGTIHTKPNATVTLRFFADWGMASGHLDPARAQGAAHIGTTTVTTDAAGDASFNVTFPGDSYYGAPQVPPAGSFITATASIAMPGATPTPTHPGLVAADTSEFSPAVPLRGMPPAVQQVYFRASAWPASFRSYLESRGFGSARYGFALRPTFSGSLASVPWPNLDEVSIRFTEDVRLEQDDLSVIGNNGGNYPVTAFNYDPQTLTATWRLGRTIPFDRVRLELDSGDEGVEATVGGADLDGEWPGASINPTGQSGNGQPGGDLVLPVTVVPGDVDRNGRANALDVAAVRAALGARPTWGPGRYSIFADLDADGRIDALDLAVVRRSILAQPPA